ncbi:hypothetical protein AM228_19730 [Planktothricoides sp. SR001]|nr:hypothetical protein AM228_19730 [Planktothricoides sp. SR001]
MVYPIPDGSTIRYSKGIKKFRIGILRGIRCQLPIIFKSFQTILNLIATTSDLCANYAIDCVFAATDKEKYMRD